MYRQMVFNALLGNTDDHLKNFWLLADADGYRLSPAFDLLPDTGARREHVLLFDLTPLPPAPAELAALGRKWGVSGAANICQEVEPPSRGLLKSPPATTCRNPKSIALHRTSPAGVAPER
jgi:hypothetical protein